MKSLVLAAALAITLAATATTAFADIKVGDHFVELDAKTAKGKNFRLKELAGKWVLFSFGADWCKPCHKELPAWDGVAPTFQGKVLFVAVDIDDDAATGQKFVSSLNLKHLFPVFMPADGSTALGSYDPSHMPSTFVIDPKGIVRYIHLGYDKGDEAELSKAVADLIK